LGRHWDGTFTLEPVDGDRTRVTSSGTFKLKGLWRVLQPFLAGELQKGEKVELDKIDALLTTAQAAMAVPIHEQP